MIPPPEMAESGVHRRTGLAGQPLIATTAQLWSLRVATLGSHLLLFSLHPVAQLSAHS